MERSAGAIGADILVVVPNSHCRQSSLQMLIRITLRICVGAATGICNWSVGDATKMCEMCSQVRALDTSRQA
jgi:hypothetical protein